MSLIHLLSPNNVVQLHRFSHRQGVIRTTSSHSRHFSTRLIWNIRLFYSPWTKNMTMLFWELAWRWVLVHDFRKQRSSAAGKLWFACADSSQLTSNCVTKYTSIYLYLLCFYRFPVRSEVLEFFAFEFFYILCGIPSCVLIQPWFWAWNVCDFLVRFNDYQFRYWIEIVFVEEQLVIYSVFSYTSVLVAEDIYPLCKWK